MTHGAIVAGIGFRHAAGAEEIVALIRSALAQAERAPGCLRAVAAAADRVGEPALREAARMFGLEAIGIAPASLQAVDARVPTRSQRIETSRGVGSVAEAAALAAAGEGAMLVLPRIASANVTCALALVPETP